MAAPSTSQPASTHKSLHIAILGASISGLALAIGLSRHAISYTVYESSPSFTTVGAGIAFGPNALRAMKMIDPRFSAAYDEIATGNSSPGKEHVFHDMLLCEEGLGLKRGWAGAEVRYECYRKSSVHRKDLLEVMRALVPAERLVFGKKAIEVRQERSKVIIVFADGTLAEADAVVGCDGGKGVTRRAVLADEDSVHEEGHSVLMRSHPEEVDAIYAGRYVYRVIVPMEDARKLLGEYVGDGKMFIGEGRYFATYQMSGGTQLNILAGHQDDEPWTHDQWTKEVTRKEMLKDFEGCDSRLIQLLDHAKPIRWSLHHHLNTPTYCNKLICLLGDAAHASTPHQGAGAGQCLEDALILSQLLSFFTCRQDIPAASVPHPQFHRIDHPIAIAHAFQSYDFACRPRAQRMVRTSDEAGKMYCFADEHCGRDVNKIVKNARERFGWIWEVDLCEEVQRAEREFVRLQKGHGGM